MKQPRYRGRFAPSPTGPLHFGSLVTALASWLEARTAGGDWLVRIEDLDPVRGPPEATGQILHSLDCHGLFADEPVRFKSKRDDAYQDAISQLLESDNAYRSCRSRKQLQAHAVRHQNHCRHCTAGVGNQPD